MAADAESRTTQVNIQQSGSTSTCCISDSESYPNMPPPKFPDNPRKKRKSQDVPLQLLYRANCQSTTPGDVSPPRTIVRQQKRLKSSKHTDLFIFCVILTDCTVILTSEHAPSWLLSGSRLEVYDAVVSSFIATNR
ncbi:hypothetical protein J6590_017070 [Homalodisca vitripennis]|nr:hypothetical protein J6590_017070 [Homalodisca vitripennis]